MWVEHVSEALTLLSLIPESSQPGEALGMKIGSQNIMLICPQPQGYKGNPQCLPGSVKEVDVQVVKAAGNSGWNASLFMLFFLLRDLPS